MPPTLHIVMYSARAEYYNRAGASGFAVWHNHTMDSNDTNGGPNYLQAWREYRGLSQAELGAKVVPPATQGTIAHLESGRTALSAKWLRRLAPALRITPSVLLELAPGEVEAEVIDLLAVADSRQRRQITDIARTILKSGGE